MTLDDVVNANERYGHIESIASTLKEDSSAPEAYDGLKAYLANYLGMAPADADALVESDHMTERRARSYARLYSKNDRNDLVAKVEANYDLVLNAVNGDKLAAFAIGLPKADKKYIMVDQALKSKEYKMVQAVLMDKYDLPIWRDFVAHGGDELAKALGSIYVHTERNKFIGEKLSDAVTNAEGKIEYHVNQTKVKSYVTATLNQYEPKQKQDAYFQLARHLG